MINNMRMFDYWQQSEEQLGKGNCEKAIEYSLQSFQEGLKWLWIEGDSLTEKDIKQIWKIHGAYTNIYKAYVCKADKLYDSKNYEEALLYRIKADSFLNINPVALNDSWKVERADSKNSIGIYYKALGQTDSTILFFAKAIVYHSDSISISNDRLATYLTNLSESLADGRYWNESNQAAKTSIDVLNTDSITKEKNDLYSTAYFQLVYNALANSDLSQANKYLSEVKQFLTPKGECKYYLFHSLLSNRLDNPIEAIENARKARVCYHQVFTEKHQNIAESYMVSFESWMKIPQYDSAISNLREGIRITRMNHGIATVRFQDYIKREGFYDYSVGNYKQSLEKLLKVKKTYERELGQESEKLPEVLATIGRVKIEQEDFVEAKKVLTEALRILKTHPFLIDERSSNLLNDLAYISYATNQSYVADTLYNKSIKLNNEVKKDSSLSVASALNGLGLIAMKNSNFSRADSLFKKSLQLYKFHYPELHPDIGIVLMNQSELSFMSMEFTEALFLVNEALENFIPFHRAKHPTLGDMYLLKAYILTEIGDVKETQILLTRALEIYESNFDPKHEKIISTRKIIQL
ncbi:hypothetical protein GCM10011506_14820 [Marivirga lumbricoides]|uniref:MalT-like TPR region domain-containing protein n=2 Tax=Marivirga lumbricoides TaxID=1046115 RepID=A0ABQ1LVM0_9BACT|nr:hypothetical protein GCM10011506_14820 [Marivirga lumbricoides]